MPLSGIVITIAFFVFVQAPAPQPPRDIRSAGGASASLAGRVIDDAGVPVAQAIVTVTGVQPGGARTAVTDADGAFLFADLPAVRVRLMASGPGYVDAEHGRDGPGDRSKRIVLVAGRRFDARLVLTRTAVITGQLTDDSGVPVPDINVVVWGVETAGTHGIGRVYIGPTNAEGVYRAWGLPPGEYAVSSWTGWEAEAAPPGAQQVTLAAGEERRGVDIRYARAVRATGRLEGLALGPDGRPIRGLRVQLFRPGNRGALSLNPVINPDGTFIFRNVPEGALQLAAYTYTHWAFADVNVPGMGRAALPPLTLRPGVRIAGRIVAGGADPPIVDLTRVFVALVPIDIPEQIINGTTTSRTNPDGTFTIGSVPPGRYTLRVSGPATSSRWTVKSAILADVNVIESPFEVRREAIGGVTITIVTAGFPEP